MKLTASLIDGESAVDIEIKRRIPLHGAIKICHGSVKIQVDAGAIVHNFIPQLISVPRNRPDKQLDIIGKNHSRTLGCGRNGNPETVFIQDLWKVVLLAGDIDQIGIGKIQIENLSTAVINHFRKSCQL